MAIMTTPLASSSLTVRRSDILVALLHNTYRSAPFVLLGQALATASNDTLPWR